MTGRKNDEKVSMLNRRDFLKATAILLASAALPSVPYSITHPHFDPSLQFGNWIPLTDNVSGDTAKIMCEEIFKKSINEVIPLEFQKHINFIYHPIPNIRYGDQFSQRGSLAWHYHSEYDGNQFVTAGHDPDYATITI